MKAADRKNDGFKDMGEERRVHRRYECKGEVCMRITPTWPAVKGTIMNLCLGGCMVGFPARQKIEISQQIELIFSVHNLPFHVQAVVKGERGKGRYGFEFPPLRERVLLQLQDLIEELDQGCFNPELGCAGAVRLK